MIERFVFAFLLAKGSAAPMVAKPDAGTASPLPVTAALKNAPVRISGDQFVIQAKENLATYSGHVKAIRQDATLSCDKLVAHYTKAQDVDSIECVGNAEAMQGDKYARGDRADFDNANGLIVVTGNPEARQGASRVNGERFVIDLARDTLRGEKVKTVATQADPTGKKTPVAIVGDIFEVQGKKNVASWRGGVKVKRGPTTLSCDRLVAHYGEDQQVRRAECVGRAEARDGEKWAAGERADYDVASGLITVTGNPRAQQGQNQMKATKFIIDLPKDIIRGDNVEMVVNPDELQQQQKKKAP